MEQAPMESNEGEEKVTRERLIEFAKERVAGDPEVREMLLRWVEETRIPEGSGVESIEYLDVAIMHSAMKYRLGFLTQEEVLQELEEEREALTGELNVSEKAKELYNKLSQLMYAVEDGVFEVVHKI